MALGLYANFEQTRTRQLQLFIVYNILFFGLYFSYNYVLQRSYELDLSALNNDKNELQAEQ